MTGALTRADTNTSGSLARRWGPCAAGVVAFTALARGAFGGGFANYDALYALVWGRALSSGSLPDYEITLAPTPKPLLIALGALLAPLGHVAAPVLVLVGYATVAALGLVVFALAARLGGVAAGALAAVLIVTREPVLSFGLRAYADPGYVALVLGALLLELRRRRAGWGPLGLLAVAGLLRPEAWLFSAVYLAWCWHSPRGARLGYLALAAAAPLIWVASDLLITGDPLWSLTGTRAAADVLGRPTGITELPLLVPRRLGEIVREPVLAAAPVGLLFGVLTRPRVTFPVLIAGALALGAFVLLAATGLPSLGRYLLLPASLLIVFAGVATLGWIRLPRSHPLRRPWAGCAALTAALLIVFAPAQFERLQRLRTVLATQANIATDLHQLADRGTLATPHARLAVPNHRPVPALSLWLGVTPSAIVAGRATSDVRAYVAPSTSRVARLFVLDPRDPTRAALTPPTGFTPAATTPTWTVYRR